MPKKYYLGIDLGTSSVKGIMRTAEGEQVKGRCGYTHIDPNGWLSAVETLIRDMLSRCYGEVCAISFSSQVGTYIVDDETVISWQDSVGEQELQEIRERFSQEEFINEISMLHPALISYPLPRLLYICKKFGTKRRVDMPKELLIRAFTGKRITDIFSMRGICHLEKGVYAESLMNKLGIDVCLPQIGNPLDMVGKVTIEAEKRFGIKSGTPVYLGCNDFFAGLIGMGIYGEGDTFELSGTSEHIGYISSEINSKAFVSGGYFNGVCTYGGTKSSGASCRLAIEELGGYNGDIGEMLSESPPIFLPYLKGERAPVFDENARGVFFGLSENTDKRMLAYSVLEGVVFSLYHIAAEIGMPQPKKIVCGGGSTVDKMMNTLRASVFGCDILRVEEGDTSALGACMMAMVGEGVYCSIPDAISHCVEYSERISPVKEYTNILRARFKVYKGLYGSLKNAFSEFSEI